MRPEWISYGYCCDLYLFVFQTILKDEKVVGSSSHRMVPDAGGLSTFVTCGSDIALRQPSFADDEIEMSKYRARLRQHMNGLEQAYVLKRICYKTGNGIV